jgi:hypothetical protein
MSFFELLRLLGETSPKFERHGHVLIGCALGRQTYGTLVNIPGAIQVKSIFPADLPLPTQFVKFRFETEEGSAHFGGWIDLSKHPRELDHCWIRLRPTNLELVGKLIAPS